MGAELTEEELARAAEEVLGGAGGAVCPDCGREFTGPNGERNLAMHRTNKGPHGEKAPAGAAARSRTRPPASPPKGPKQTATDAAIDAVVSESVGYVIFGAGLLSYALPYTGVAIAGVANPDQPDPNKPDAWIVTPRALTAGRILAGHAKRDARILEMLERFNAFCRGSEGATLAAQIGATLALDFQMIQPDQEVQLGPLKLGPKLLVGDVIEEVELREKEWAEAHPEEAAARAAAAASNGRARGTTQGAGAGPEAPGVTAT